MQRTASVPTADVCSMRANCSDDMRACAYMCVAHIHACTRTHTHTRMLDPASSFLTHMYIIHTHYRPTTNHRATKACPVTITLQDPSTLYSILYTLYSILYTLYSILYTLYSVLCTLYSVLCTLYSVLCTLYSILYTIYTFSSRPFLPIKNHQSYFTFHLFRKNICTVFCTKYP